MGEISGGNCPLCGNGNCHARLIDGPVRVVKCADCGVAWREGEPPVTPSAFAGSRFDFGRITSAPGCDGPPLTCSGLSPNPPFSPHIGLLEIELTNELKRPPGMLLNVGLDTVDFLENAKICGWNAVSVSDLAALPQCAALTQQDVAGLQEESEQGGFDIVRLEGILERASDPVVFLKRAIQLQNQNGLLVISTVGFGALDFALYGEGAMLSRSDLPRWFFTSKALGLILRRAGLAIVRLKELQNPPRLSAFARRSMHQQYRGLRRWIDPDIHVPLPHLKHPMPA